MMESGGGERTPEAEPTTGTDEVEAALRRLMSAEREFDTTSEALASQRSEPPHSVSEQAVRTIESVHRLAMEVEEAAHERAAAIEREGSERAATLIADAEAERERMWVELRSLLDAGMAEVERLQSVRDRLTADLSRALGESNAALERLDEPAERVARPPTDPAPGREPAPPVLVRVDLEAGPFTTFSEVLAFESELAGLDGVTSVYVSRFADGAVRASLGGRTREEMVAGIRGLPSITGLDETGEILSARLRQPAH